MGRPRRQSRGDEDDYLGDEVVLTNGRHSVVS